MSHGSAAIPLLLLSLLLLSSGCGTASPAAGGALPGGGSGGDPVGAGGAGGQGGGASLLEEMQARRAEGCSTWCGIRATCGIDPDQESCEAACWTEMPLPGPQIAECAACHAAFSCEGDEGACDAICTGESVELELRFGGYRSGPTLYWMVVNEEIDRPMVLDKVVTIDLESAWSSPMRVRKGSLIAIEWFFDEAGSFGCDPEDDVRRTVVRADGPMTLYVRPNEGVQGSCDRFIRFGRHDLRVQLRGLDAWEGRPVHVARIGSDPSEQGGLRFVMASGVAHVRDGSALVEFENIKNDAQTAIAWYVDTDGTAVCTETSPGGLIDVGRLERPTSIAVDWDGERAICPYFPGGADLLVEAVGLERWEGAQLFLALTDPATGVTTFAPEPATIEDGAATIEWPGAARPGAARVLSLVALGNESGCWSMPLVMDADERKVVPFDGAAPVDPEVCARLRVW